MPSDFPRSPRLMKGALVAFEGQFLGPIPNVIVFQYNPDQLVRKLDHRTPPAPPGGANLGAAREEAIRVIGPPVETITLTVNLSAADQLAEPGTHPQTVAFGLHPALAALEMLLHPPMKQLLRSRTLARGGRPQTDPEEAPLVLFVWGASRVLPVRLASFSVTEEAFDPALNPIQAKVDLVMNVMTTIELMPNSLGFGAYVATQARKEVLARLNLVNGAEQILGLLR